MKLASFTFSGNFRPAARVSKTVKESCERFLINQPGKIPMDKLENPSIFEYNHGRPPSAYAKYLRCLAICVGQRDLYNIPSDIGELDKKIAGNKSDGAHAGKIVEYSRTYHESALPISIPMTMEEKIANFLRNGLL